MERLAPRPLVASRYCSDKLGRDLEKKLRRLVVSDWVLVWVNGMGVVAAGHPVDEEVGRLLKREVLRTVVLNKDKELDALHASERSIHERRLDAGGATSASAKSLRDSQAE
jgi:hypothetical protein